LLKNFGLFRRFRRLRRFRDFFFGVLKLLRRVVPFRVEIDFFFLVLLLLDLRGGQFRWHITLLKSIL